MALKDKRKMIIDRQKSLETYLNYNHVLLNIFRGGLLPEIEKILKSSLTEQYFNAIKDRILPLNVLPRYISKLAKAYATSPQRVCENEQEQMFVDYYTRVLCLNKRGMSADNYANLFKGFAWDPYISAKGMPKLRTLPFDRFFVVSEDQEDPNQVDIFVKLIGKREVMSELGKRDLKEVFYTYTDTEFDAFDQDGNTYFPALAENEGINPYGVIPQVYGNRGDDELIPTQDTDLLQFTTVVPVMFSDIAGAAMFQCFSLMYGIDVNAENLVMAPNAFWSLKSDQKSDKEPKIGVIKPEVDIDKFVGLIINSFVFWLETKGIRVNGVGSMNASEVASGISKIIDEMDTYEVRKQNIKNLEEDEQALWKNLAKLHNYWIKSGMLADKSAPGLVNPDIEVKVIYDEPRPFKTREQILAEIESEMKLGIIGRLDAAKKLYPDFDEDAVREMLERADEVIQDNPAQPDTQEPDMNDQQDPSVQ